MKRSYCFLILLLPYLSNAQPFLLPVNHFVQTVFVNGSYQHSGADSVAAIILSPTQFNRGSTKIIATVQQVGAVWSLANEPVTKRLFAAAVAKRHSGFGPLGSGGIYMVSTERQSVKPFLSLDALGFPTAPNKLVRDLPDSFTSFSHDSTMFSLVGKCSLGGLDVSDDGQVLYTVNLFDRKLYRIQLPEDGSSPTTAQVRSIPLPNPGCTGGQFRPFAVKYYEGKLYVGGVCDAQISGNVTDLQATVFTYEEQSGTFKEVFTTRLDYPRGKLDYGISAWTSWTDDYTQAVVPQAPNWLIRPQPMLADIEFDTDGSMILGIMDRLGHQTSDGQWFRPKGSKQLQQYRGLSGGDVLRVAYIKSATGKGRYELERNARADTRTTKGRGQGQGPSGGEFYFDDNFQAGGQTWHHETATGGLAMLPESNQLLVSTREPVSGEYGTGGVKLFSNQTGQALGGQSVFPGGERAGYVWKANSVGDIELITEVAPINLMSSVWEDRNGNGQQEPDEKGLAGVDFFLYLYGQRVASGQTKSDGQVSFSAASVKGGLRFGTAYEIHIPLQQKAHGTLLLTKLQETTHQSLTPASPVFVQGGTVIGTLHTKAAGQPLPTQRIGLRLASTTSEEAEHRLKLTPIPTSGPLTIDYKGLQSDGSLHIEVINVAGQVIKQTTGVVRNGSHQSVLDLTSFPAGTYYLTVKEGDQRITKSLLKF